MRSAQNTCLFFRHPNCIVKVIEVAGYSSADRKTPYTGSNILLKLSLFIGTINREDKKFSSTLILLKFTKSTHGDNSI